MLLNDCVDLNQRAHTDIKEIEKLAALVVSLDTDLDGLMTDIFERLVDLVGTREFLPTYAEINGHFQNVLQRRNGAFGLGYSLSWTAVYSLPHAGTGTSLGAVATQVRVS